MKYRIEHTDTFGGEANYCWIRTKDIESKEPLSRLALVRQAKAFARISGVRSEVTDFGDSIEIRPAGLCRVVFITVEDP